MSSIDYGSAGIEPTWRAGDLIAQFAVRWTAGVNNSTAWLTGDIPAGLMAPRGVDGQAGKRRGRRLARAQTNLLTEFLARQL